MYGPRIDLSNCRKITRCTLLDVHGILPTMEQSGKRKGEVREEGRVPVSLGILFLSGGNAQQRQPTADFPRHPSILNTPAIRTLCYRKMPPAKLTKFNRLSTSVAFWVIIPMSFPEIDSRTTRRKGEIGAEP